MNRAGIYVDNLTGDVSYDELYVMSYREYMRRKAVISFVKKTFWNKTQKQAALFQKPNEFLK